MMTVVANKTNRLMPDMKEIKAYTLYCTDCNKSLNQLSRYCYKNNLLVSTVLDIELGPGGNLLSPYLA